ncbi:B-cell receptor CD22-like [Sphaeramia orbicularis]|uniref:B-cell receptor CD22-like n=1 Tax=Sphaeramia orbicularis TaxID=375764 RepID=UPI00118145DF|nr:B-cell receptor CD22-like [Sphaeramia orbicularis]
MRTATTMSLTSASGFIVFLLSVTVVQGQNGWGVTYATTQICALKGSTVDMSCTYTYPQWINNWKTTVEKTFWFINSDIKPVDLKTKSEYKGRVYYSYKKNDCFVRISDLRQSDSAQYQFSFMTNQPGGRYTGSPGVTLTVTAHPDLQVHVTRSSSCRNSNCVQVELRCHSSCRLPDNYKYTWFKNRQKIHSQTSSSYSTSFSSEDTVSCAVKLGSEMFSSPPVFAPTVPSVSFSPSGEIIEGSSVTLTCTSDANPPVTKYTWYKRGKNQLQSRGEGQQFVLSFINSSDSGSYSCQTENSLGLKMSEYVYINVKYPPRLPSVSVSPSGQIVEGSSVTLTCTSDANPPVTKYTWYKEDEDSPKASGQNFTITDFRSEHSGNYYCEAQNSRGRQNSTSHLVTVSERTTFIMNIIRLALVFLLLIPLIFLTLQIRMKKTQTINTELKPPETIELDNFQSYENEHVQHREERRLTGGRRPDETSSDVEVSCT